MTDPAAEKKTTPWYKWPNEWRQDQLFWRDVASRAIAGLIVVGVGAFLAVASGLFRGTRYEESFAELAENLGVLTVGLFVFALIAFWIAKPRRIHKVPIKFLPIKLMLFIAGVLGYYVAAQYVLSWYERIHHIYF